MPAYTPTEGPAVRPAAIDTRRHVAAVIRTVDFTDHRTTESVVTLGCHSHDLDPEWRSPIQWLSLMLESDEGQAVLADWRRMAENSHADAYSVTVMVDGVYLIDCFGRDVLAEYEQQHADSDRAVVNP